MSIARMEAWTHATPVRPVRLVLNPLPVEPPDPSPTPRILIVEDSPLIAMDLAQMLADENLPGAVIAASLAEARAALADGAFDIALLDVTLPDGRADALLGELGGARVAIVSAYGPDELSGYFSGLPHLSKPVRQDLLSAFVRDYAEAASGQSMR